MSRRLSSWKTVGIAVLVGFSTGLMFGEHPSGDPPSSDPSHFLSALLRKHPYLFEENVRAQLDSLNRDLREAAKVAKEGSIGERGKKGAATTRQALNRLDSLLNTVPSKISLDLRTGLGAALSDSPVLLPGAIGGLLLRIVTGEEQTGYFTADHTLAVEEGSDLISIEIAPKGTTWAVVSLTDIPVGMTSLVFEFRDQALDPVRLPLDVLTPQPGRLKVIVLSSDTGKPTPAMVRLVWKTNGLDYKPSNAVDFTPQFEGQGKTSSRRPANLPGKLRGEYWCVPGPFDMSVPPGDWEIVVRRGLEHIPIFDTVSLKSGQTLEKTYQPRRWVDMPELGWYSGDDHVHFRMLSDDDALRLLTWVRAEDVHLVNVAKMGDVYRTFFEQRGFGPEHRIEVDDYILSPGQEGPRTHGRQRIGHVLAMNISRMVRDTDRYYLYDWVLESVRRDGGLVGYAHALKYHHADRDMSLNIPRDIVDFVEIMQVGKLGTEIYYEFLNLGFKLTASAGSDTPYSGTVGEERVYAFVGEQQFTADTWFEAMGNGRTFVSNGPMIEFSVDGALPGDEILVEGTRSLQVKAQAWGDPERLTPASLEIVLHGEVVHSVRSDDPTQRELTADFELDAGDGFWVAARSKGSDGSSAHTTPVYVVRKPLRFWKHEAVDSLIDKRLASLTQIREMVSEVLSDSAQFEDTERNNWQWWQLKRLLEQGPELLDQVSAAEGIYHELRETNRRERAIRVPTR